MPSLGYVGLPPFDVVGGTNYNDEFNDPSTLTDPWGENAGDPTTLALDIDDTIPGGLYLWGQLYKEAPTPPFTVTAKVVYVDWTRVAGVPQVGGIWINIAAAAPGPYLGAGVDVGTPPEMQLTGTVFDAAGNFVSNIHSGALQHVFDDSYAVPHITRMTVDSATSVDWDISFNDGASWTNILTNYNPGFAINYIGLESGGARSGWDYFRVTQP